METPQYLDFELEIGPRDRGTYPVSVIRSPAGEARTTMTWPFSELELENRLLALQNALLRSGGQLRKALTPEEETVQRFGQELFDALFSDEVRERFYVSRNDAEHRGAGLRLKLRISAPELAALPWEFLFDHNLQDYVCLSRNTPIVRYLELPQRIRPLAVNAPLRVLAMVASPTDLDALDMAVERQRIERATADLVQAGLLEVHWLEGATWRDLQRAMRRGPWHIFHFVGHGGFDLQRQEGLLLLCDREGRADPLSAGNLARLLSDHTSLRLALLNSCDGARAGKQDIFSSTAATLVRAGIPAVLAMQYQITDTAAMEFATSFYESITDGLPVDAALSEARKAIQIGVRNSLEWGTPVLMTRAADGRVFAGELGVGSRGAREPGGGTKTDRRPLNVDRGQANGEEDLRRRPEPSSNPSIPSELPTTGGRSSVVDDPSSKLSGEDFALLFDALLQAFDRPGLQRLLRFHLDENLDAVVGGDNQRDRVFQLLNWAESRGLVEELVAAALQENSGNRRLQAAAAALQGGAEAARGSERPYPATKIDIDWVTVPAGEFLMGSDKRVDRYADTNETPQHLLFLPEYRIGRVPVTNAHYRLFVDATGHSAPAHWKKGHIPKGKNKHPVVNVSWHDAIAFCDWAGVQLPSEAQWEKAARGADGRIRPWGNQPPDKSLCNFGGNVGDTTEVGSYAAGASPTNCLDMAGNVWEWTHSRFKPYPYDIDDGREGDSGRAARVLRGGSFYLTVNYLRCAARNWDDPDLRYWGNGFRVVCSPHSSDR